MKKNTIRNLECEIYDLENKLLIKKTKLEQYEEMQKQAIKKQHNSQNKVLFARHNHSPMSYDFGHYQEEFFANEEVNELTEEINTLHAEIKAIERKLRSKKAELSHKKLNIQSSQKQPGEE